MQVSVRNGDFAAHWKYTLYKYDCICFVGVQQLYSYRRQQFCGFALPIVTPLRFSVLLYIPLSSPLSSDHSVYTDIVLITT
jgi:hypothetical protein